MGKTVISFAIHDQLKKRGLIKRSLVVGTKKIIQNVWRQEAKNWSFSKDFTFSTIHGSTYRGTPEYSRRMAFLDDVDIHLINYEGLQWLADHLHRTQMFPWDAVFYDESTKIKNSTTKRFKAFRQWMKFFEYRYCLTGTPIPNSLEDIFGQAFVIDKGQALGERITHFRTKFMKPLYQINQRKTVYGERDGARKKVAAKIAPRVTYLKKTDHLKLPPLNVFVFKLDMPERLREDYDEFEQELAVSVEGEGLESFSKPGVAMKLRQFLQGAVYQPDGSVIHIHNEKLKALVKLKAELEGNTLVAYNFRFERDLLRTVTSNTAPFLDARTTDRETEDWIIGWNNYEYPFFLVNPASAAFGLNLQAGGNNVIWYGLTWNAEHYSQLIDRLWRQGQRSPVNVFHIVFRNTVDELISKALKRKDRDQTALLNDIIKYTKGRY